MGLSKLGEEAGNGEGKRRKEVDGKAKPPAVSDWAKPRAPAVLRSHQMNGGDSESTHPHLGMEELFSKWLAG